MYICVQSQKNEVLLICLLLTNSIQYIRPECQEGNFICKIKRITSQRLSMARNTIMHLKFGQSMRHKRPPHNQLKRL